MEFVVRLVDAGSMARAGAEFGVRGSTVSRRLSRLETRLSVKLINVSTRGMGLTDAGRLYYEKAQRIVADIADLEAQVEQSDGTPRGTIRFTHSPGYAFDHFAPIFTGFCARYPEIILEHDESTRFTDLIAGGYHCAIRNGPVSDSDLVAHRLWSFDLHLFASKGYLDTHGRPSSAKELAEHQGVAGFGGGDASVALWPLRAGGMTSARLAFSSNSIVMQRAAVLDGIGIGLLPDSLVAAHRTELEPVLPDVVGTAGTTNLVLPHRSKNDPKVRAFVDFVVPRLKAIDLTLLVDSYRPEYRQA